MTSPRYTQLRGLAQTAEIHTARYDDREFIVIPVAAMVGGAVVRPLGSEGPEYVPPEVLAVAPGQWANRPIMADHPENGTASANSPKILEAERYGWTFEPEYRAGKLWVKAYLDPARAAEIGGDAQRVVETARRALAGEDVEPIEVSIGAWVVLAKESGTAPNGKSYSYKWLAAYSDHLAVGLNGSPGACGVEDGCGAIRSNQEESEPPRKALMRAADLEINMSDTEKQGKGRAAAESENLHQWLRDALEAAEANFDYLWVESFDAEAGTVVYSLRTEGGGKAGTYQRSYELDGETVTIGEERTPVRRRVVYEEAPEMTAAKLAMPAALVKVLGALGFRSAQDEGPSDVEMRERMEKALRGAVPAYRGIAEIFHETSTVIYATHPDEEMLWWRRTFALGDEGEITLNDDEEQVEIEQTWVPVQARLEFDTAEGDGAPCGCNKTGDGPAALTATRGDEPMSEKLKESVGRLIANEASPYTDKDEERLLAMSEEHLATLETAFNPAEEGEGAEAEESKEAKPVKATEEAPKAEESAAPAAPAKVDEEKAEAEDAETVQLKKDEHERLLRAAEAWEAEDKRRKAEEARRKGELVASLKAAQEVFDEDDLKALSLAQLEKLARTHELAEEASAPDYSGRGAANAGEGERKAPPKPWSMALAKQRGDNAGKEATN